ncbi:hypothetical protein GCK32_000899 [Trichostrongylus colubriformis]|uniref:Uncharacterized protein n=1 Tax=Trichostrongylus colubriformis TaxID=6319 RepID=A0AAN8FI09_TRICO
MDSEEGREYIRREHIGLRKASKIMEMEMKNVENSLRAYNTEAGNLPPHNPQLMDVLEKVKANATKEEELLKRAFSTASRIAEQREELEALSET